MRRHLLLILLLLPPLLALALYLGALLSIPEQLFLLNKFDPHAAPGQGGTTALFADSIGLYFLHQPLLAEPLYSGPSPEVFTLPGLRYEIYISPDRSILYSRSLFLHHLLLLTLTSLPVTILLLIRLRQHLRQRHLRLNPTLCPNCSYDLRATPTRCPECGHPFPPTAPIAKMPP